MCKWMLVILAQARRKKIRSIVRFVSRPSTVLVSLGLLEALVAERVFLLVR